MHYQVIVNVKRNRSRSIFHVQSQNSTFLLQSSRERRHRSRRFVTVQPLRERTAR